MALNPLVMIYERTSFCTAAPTKVTYKQQSPDWSLTYRLELGLQVQHLGLHVSYDYATSWRGVIHAHPLVQGPKNISLGRVKMITIMDIRRRA